MHDSSHASLWSFRPRANFFDLNAIFLFHIASSAVPAALAYR